MCTGARFLISRPSFATSLATVISNSNCYNGHLVSVLLYTYTYCHADWGSPCIRAIWIQIYSIERRCEIGGEKFDGVFWSVGISNNG